MSTANLTAVIAAVAGLVTAITGLVVAVRHVTGPAHKDTPAPAVKQRGQAPAPASGPPMSSLPPTARDTQAPPEIPHP